jgi:predicted membrane channel-forming protein YqfA (hemolysin III family)
MVIIGMLFAAVLFYQTRTRYYTPAFHCTRVFIYTSLTAYGLLPVLHWVYLNGGFNTPLVQIFAPRIAIVYFLGLLAAVFYVSKIPERLLPGRFDYIGASHQCWHIIVVVAFCWWHCSATELFRYQQLHPCQESS